MKSNKVLNDLLNTMVYTKIIFVCFLTNGFESQGIALAILLKYTTNAQTIALAIKS